MLKVEEYLQNKSLKDLEEELGIYSKKHPDLPLIILDYSQIESSKTNPIVRECRGLVLDDHSKKLVAKSFNRFFNWGEMREEEKLFNFNDFVVQDKEDGTLINIFYFSGSWRINTRFTFGLDRITHQDFTWTDLVVKILGLNDINDFDKFLDRKLNYVCELCTIYNKIVRSYTNPSLYLLTVFDKYKELKLGEYKFDIFKTPCIHNFNSIDSIINYVSEQSHFDPTYEGVVIRDNNNNRWKIKSPKYLALHKMSNGNIFNPKCWISFLVSGEEDEFLTYYPEVKNNYLKLKEELFCEYNNLLDVYEKSQNIKEQKEFAQFVIKKTKFSFVLFNLRKTYGEVFDVKILKKAFFNEEVLLKWIKNKS